MRVTIYSIGKFGKNDPMHAIFKEYQKRLPWDFHLKELVAEPATPAKESVLLENAFTETDYVIALDNTGTHISSPELAQKLEFVMETKRHIAFIIGGADGLLRDMVARADMKITLGNLTWPHKLVRVMLAEQLYRAHTIQTGHPYHR